MDGFNQLKTSYWIEREVGYAKMKLKLITMMIFKQLECIQQYFAIEDWKKREKDNYNSIEEKNASCIPFTCKILNENKDCWKSNLKKIFSQCIFHGKHIWRNRAETRGKQIVNMYVSNTLITSPAAKEKTGWLAGWPDIFLR